MPGVLRTFANPRARETMYGRNLSTKCRCGHALALPAALHYSQCRCGHVLTPALSCPQLLWSGISMGRGKRRGRRGRAFGWAAADRQMKRLGNWLVVASQNMTRLVIEAHVSYPSMKSVVGRISACTC